MRRIDVRRDIDGNVDQDFYTAWDTAVYERSAEANINNDLQSAWIEADIWYQREEDRLNLGAVASRRNVNNSRTTASSRRRISTAVDIGSDQNFAVPVAAPIEAPRSKKRRVDNRPSSTTIASTDVSARRSVFDRIDDRIPEPQ